MAKPALVVLFALVLTLVPRILPAQSATVGLQRYTPQVADGYVLLAPTLSDTTYLIDNCGRLINSWADVYNPGNCAYLLPNGNLLRLSSEGQPANPYFNAGGASDHIRLFDWDGNLLWNWSLSTPQFRLHHDLTYLPNGNVLAIAWEGIPLATAFLAGRDPDKIGASVVWSEIILEIEPHFPDSGAIVWQWRVWDHLIQNFDSARANWGDVSQHPERVDLNYLGAQAPNNPDWIHFNSIEYHAELDQIMLSPRSFSEVWVIDHSTTTTEAAGSTGGRYGKGGDLLYRWGNPLAYQQGSSTDRQLYVQHHPHWIPDSLPRGGQVMVFNNGTDRPGGDYSSIDVFDPPQDSAGFYTSPNPWYGPAQASWSYTTPVPTDFYAKFISNAQTQPNGNVLINEGVFGHLFEINPQGFVVWDYICPIDDQGRITQGNPPNNGPNNTLNNRLFRAYRYPENYAAFTGRTLTPGELLEREPTLPPCIPNANPEAQNMAPVEVFPNPATDFIFLRAPQGPAKSLQVMDLYGRTTWAGQLKAGNQKIDTRDWEPGIYFLVVDTGTYTTKLLLR